MRLLYQIIKFQTVIERMNIFSLPISFVMIERIYILCLIIIIKSEVWIITHCLGLSHETMVCAVCLSIFFEYFLWNCAHVNTARLHWWLFNIVSGNGLVPSGNKPSPEPMLIQVYVAIWPYVITGLGKGLSPVWLQAITWTITTIKSLI